MFKNIKDYVKQEKDRLSNFAQGRLLILQVGNEEASNRYVRNKCRDCAEVGIAAEVMRFEEGATDEVIAAIEKCGDGFTGIMLQLPAKGVDVERVVAAIPAEKDVDGMKVGSKFVPCTARGIMDYLRYCGFDFEGKNVLVIGRSEIVGKPVAAEMLKENATVTIAHSKTRRLGDYVSRADLIVCAVGKPKFLNCYAVRCPVVDVGINVVAAEAPSTEEVVAAEKIVGDCYNTENREVTPVPGGVGLLTRLALLKNVSGELI